MARTKSKGTLFQLTVSSVMTTVAQCVDLTPPGWKSSDFETMELDQAGVGEGRDLTGYVSGQDIDAEVFWDPELAVHAALLALVTTPAKGTCQVVFVNAGASEIDFVTAGAEFQPQVKMGDGVKGKFKASIDGSPVLTV